MTKDEKIAKLGKEITDRATVLLGKDKITPDAPEYLGINSALKFTAVKYDEKMADDILDIALTMKKRVPLTIEQLAKKNPQFDRAYLEKAMQAISESGLVEFHWENLDGKNPNHEKRWVLDMFVPGSAEIMMINPEQSDMFPETADFFERMAYLPLAGITEMVPPGGAGIGMHVIPVEKAIPAESKSLPIEHLSHWLKKYEGHIGVSVCSCRKQQRIRGEGSGDVEGEWCIGVGDFADYCRETNHGHDITYEEAMEILQKAEDRGYVHQITNIDGENKIFGICNCAVGVCNALRTSQLFNTPNLSASAYVAESDPEKCVACGKCVEACPAGAVRLGQKLCTKEGPIQYPHHELPDDTKWGEDHWNKNYRNENGCIQTWPTGTAPCKAACPAHIAIQGYIKMAGDGRYADALKLIKKDKHLLYFENLLQEAHNDLIAQAQNEGKICVAYACENTPEPLLNLPGAFSTRLRAPRTGSMEMATYYMTSFLCEYSRALLERAIEGGYNFADCMITPDGCSMMNRAVENMELLKTMGKDKPKFFFEYMEIPMKADDNGLNLYVLQCRNHILTPLHDVYGIDVSDEAIRKSVAEHNRVCELIRAIGEYRKGPNPRITGYEFHVITLATYVAPKYLLIDKLEETLKELKTRRPDKKNPYRARVVVVGSEVDDIDFIKLVEETGAYVCADRFCYGSFPGRDPIVLTDDEDALTQICRQYMNRAQCPRYMNMPKMIGRREYVNQLAKEYEADGIIYEQIKFCDPWAYERMLGSHILNDDYGYPVLSVDRPYNIASSGQMRTRVQAFVESMEIKKIQGGKQ